MLIFLADVIVVLHFALLIFLVVGAILALRWRWLIYPHLLIACWAVVTSAWAVPCPMTMLENWLRAQAGIPPLRADFVEAYVVNMGHEFGSLNRLRVLTLFVVVASWVLFAMSGRWTGRAGGPAVFRITWLMPSVAHRMKASDDIVLAGQSECNGTTASSRRQTRSAAPGSVSRVNKMRWVGDPLSEGRTFGRVRGVSR